MRRYHVEVKDHTLHEEHLIAIGLIVVEWSLTEANVEHSLWALAEIDEFVGLALTTHMSSENRLLALETLSFGRPPKKINEKNHEALLKLLKRFKELRTRRNKIVHSVWRKNKKGFPKMYRFTAKGKIAFTVESASVPELLKLSREIYAFRRKFLTFFRKRYPHALSSRNKSS